jgi:hypothetical protein
MKYTVGTAKVNKARSLSPKASTLCSCDFLRKVCCYCRGMYKCQDLSEIRETTLQK